MLTIESKISRVRLGGPSRIIWGSCDHIFPVIIQLKNTRLDFTLQKRYILFSCHTLSVI